MSGKTASPPWWYLPPPRIDRQTIGTGLRIATAFVAPLVAGLILNQPHIAVGVALGALNVAMADQGGTYERRFPNLMFATGFVTLVGFTATLVAPHPWLAVALTMLVGFLGGFVGVLGITAGAIALVCMINFSVVQGFPSDGLPTALRMGGALLAGGLWSSFLGLMLLPLRPYQPAKDGLALAAGGVAGLLRASLPLPCDDGARPPMPSRSEVLGHLENARQTLLQIRAERSGTSNTGRNLDQLARTVFHAHDVAVLAARLLTILASDPAYFRLHEPLAALIETLAGDLDGIALTLRSNEPRDAVPVSLASLRRAIEVELASMDEERAGRFRHLSRELGELAALISAIHEIANHLGQAPFCLDLPRLSLPLGKEQRKQALDTLRANLNLESLFLRHALRLALVMGVAAAIYRTFDINHGYWLILAVVFVLKPDFGGSRQAIIGRTVWTAAGSVIGGLLLALIHHPWLLLAILYLLAAAAASQLRPNFRLGTLLMTPMIIILLALFVHGGWELAVLRTVDTGVGALLALAASQFILPQWASGRLLAALAAALAAHARFLECLLGTVNGEVSFDQLVLARRAAERKTANTQLVLQQMLSEPIASRPDDARAFFLVFTGNDVLDRLTALRVYSRTMPEMLRAAAEVPGFHALADELVASLRRLASGLVQGNTGENQLLRQALDTYRVALDALPAEDGERLLWRVGFQFIRLGQDLLNIGEGRHVAGPSVSVVYGAAAAG